jgi:hypothetical protein
LLNQEGDLKEKIKIPKDPKIPEIPEITYKLRQTENLQKPTL